MEFEIGDLVEIVSETNYAEVVGIIHDDERIFVVFPDGSKEQEYPFSVIVKQWRLLPIDEYQNGVQAAAQENEQ